MPVLNQIDDVERLTTYSPVLSAGPFEVGFPLYGTGEYIIWLDGVEQESWTETATFVDGVSVDATVTAPAPVTGTLKIEGRRVPKRPESDQFDEMVGVPSSQMNSIMNRLTAVARELYDRVRKIVQFNFLNLGETPNDSDGEDGHIGATTGGQIWKKVSGTWVDLGLNFTGPKGDIGPPGPGGPGTGDMLASVYDPGGAMDDAFNMGNMSEAAAAKILTADERTQLGEFRRIASKAAAQALAAGAYPAILLNGSVWKWDASDLSTEVASDAQAGVYIAPASDTSGASGALVRQYDGPVFAHWFGVDPSLADNASLLQAAINFLPDAFPNFRMLPGTYTINSDVTIGPFGETSSGSGRLDFSGVHFAGTGNIIIDSMKRCEIHGPSMPNQDVKLRSLWASNWHNLQCRDMIIQDAAGTNFSSMAWVRFFGGWIQQVKVDAAAASYANQIDFYGTRIAGSAGAGFLSSRDYALDFQGDIDCRSWNFRGGDISYHNTAIWRRGAGNTTGKIAINFDGVFFDTLIPEGVDDEKTQIDLRRCQTGTNVNEETLLSAAFRGAYELRNQDRNTSWHPFCPRNLQGNGDLDPGVSYVKPTGPFNPSSTTLTSRTATGADVGFHDNYVEAENASAGTLFVHSSGNIPFDGPITYQAVIRSTSGEGDVTMSLGLGGQFQSFDIVESEWRFITFTPKQTFAAGTEVSGSIARSGGGNWKIDIAFSGMYLGIKPAMLGA